MATETRQHRLKRLRMRSWRRGTKEMDLVLGPFADACLSAMDPDELALYERMLEENDHDLYAWVSGRSAPPAGLRRLVRRIAQHAGIT